jgi:hypothetical protein
MNFAGRLLRLIIVATTLMLGVACAAPATVDGVVAGDTFTIRDDDPTLRPRHEGATLVLADQSGNMLRIVTITLPDVDTLPLEEDIPFADNADEGPVLEASFGTVEEIVRSDGVKVLNSTDSVGYTALEGTLRIETAEPLLSGSFRATLDEGGALEGSFVILPE